MGRLIEQQAVIDCLTNTAKYYEREDADEWTKGIHYGLLHGLDNILDNVSTVEAIPKADYENRLKVDIVTMLEELQSEIREYHEIGCNEDCNNCRMVGCVEPVNVIKDLDIIQQKITALKENTGE